MIMMIPNQKIPNMSLIEHHKDGIHVDFVKYQHVKKNWGSETWIVNHGLYCMKLLDLKEGKMCSVHFHKEKDETFHIAQGRMKIEIWLSYGEKTFEEDKPDHIHHLWAGMSIRIKPNTAHRFTGMAGDCQFIEISTQHKEEDSYRIIPSPP